MPTDTSIPVHHRTRASGVAAFSLVEVIIAMLLLSIVVSGAAVAVTSSDRVDIATKAVADQHSMATKASERLRVDLSARAGCDSGSGGWIASARAAKLGTGAAADFAPCLIRYHDMKDAKGRLYLVDIVVEPIDDTSDGTGIKDTDGNLRDRHELTSTVALAADSKAGRELTPNAVVAGSVEWEEPSADVATVQVIACAVDRPDRAHTAGSCVGSEDASRQEMNISVSVTRVLEGTTNTQSAGTIASGSTPGVLEPGSYRFSAPATSGAYRLVKLDPPSQNITSGQSYTIHATYVRSPTVVRVCTQIVNHSPAHLNQYGQAQYEVTQTNLHYRRSKQPAFRSVRLYLNSNLTWNCQGVPAPSVNIPGSPVETVDTHELRDPVQPNSPLYRGLYDMEIELVSPGLQLASLTVNCNVAAPWNAPSGGTLVGSRTADEFERSGYSPTSQLARLALEASAGPQSICMRFVSQQMLRMPCSAANHAASPSWCFELTPRTCAMPAGITDNDGNCENGAHVCIAYCDRTPIATTVTTPGTGVGTLGPTYSRSFGGGGGPNDTTTKCTNIYAGGGHLPAPNPVFTNRSMAQIMSNRFIGGYSGTTTFHSARAGHSFGVHPDRYTYNLPDWPTFHCQDVSFSQAKDGFWGNQNFAQIPYYTCLEVSIPGSPIKIRGRMLDVAPGRTGTDIIQIHLGGALLIAPGADRLQNHWNFFGSTSMPSWFSYFTGNQFPPYPGSPASNNWVGSIGAVGGQPRANVTVVNNDPVCNGIVPATVPPTTTTVYVDPPPVVTQYHAPVITPATYAYINDNGGINSTVPPLAFDNLGTDGTGV